MDCRRKYELRPRSDNQYWISVQIKMDLFQVRDSIDFKASRWLRKSTNYAIEERVTKSKMFELYRRYFTLCNFAGKYVYVMAGCYNDTLKRCYTAERFEISKQVW